MRWAKLRDELKGRPRKIGGLSDYKRSGGETWKIKADGGGDSKTISRFRRLWYII